LVGEPRRHPERLALLTDVLRKKYPGDHQVVLYYASTFPLGPPKVRKFPLRTLSKRHVYPMEMLYVPPV